MKITISNKAKNFTAFTASHKNISWKTAIITVWDDGDVSLSYDDGSVVKWFDSKEDAIKLLEYKGW